MYDMPQQQYSQEIHYSAFYAQNENPIIQQKEIKDKSIDDLSCTDEDRKNISYIITTLAYNGYGSLLFKQGQLRRTGDKIKVHPLKFLEVVLSSPRLKPAFKKLIEEGGMKWSNFEENFAKSLNDQNKNDNLLPYLKSFSQKTNISYDSLKSLLEKKDYAAFFKKLVSP